MKNYSRQREAILNVIRMANNHPTADWIYAETQKLIPNISLGTVYRNLSALKKAGEILSVDVGDGKEHFDGNISPHLHLSCKKCGCIIDAEIVNTHFKNLLKDYGFVAEITVYVVYGYCKDCSGEN